MSQVFAGKLAAEVVAVRASRGSPTPTREIAPSILAKAAQYVAKDPVGVKGDGAIAFDF